MSDKYTVIIDGARTPIGMKNGKLIGMRSDDLSASLIKQLLERNDSISHKNIEDIVMGCAFPEGPQGMLMAKGVAILSGLPETTSGKVVNRFCGSSMDALHQLSQAIDSGDTDCGIACGVEDMFGFKRPVPRATNTKPRIKVCSRGIAKVKWPKVIIKAPINTDLW